MVVCKFFQQGNCRYGQNCRFEHVYGSKYSYHAPTPQSAVQQTSSLTDEQLANQVHSDVQTALNGGQWLLSCYAPFKEKPCIPGISDLSPEEARLLIYEAKAKNNMEAVVAILNKHMQDTRLKFEQLLHPTLANQNLFKSLYHGGTVQSPFSNQNQVFGTSSSSANSIFRSAVQNTSFSPTNNLNNSIFSQTSNMYSSQQAPNIFAPQQDSAKSIFANANQNVFAAAQPINPFHSSTQDPAKSIFAQATQNVFGPSPPSKAPSSMFGGDPQSTFGQMDISKQSPDLFTCQGATVSPFQILDKPTTNVFGSVLVDSIIDEKSIYSNIEDLSASNVEAYQAPTFELGFVPELPPPIELCR